MANVFMCPTQSKCFYWNNTGHNTCNVLTFAQNTCSPLGRQNENNNLMDHVGMTVGDNFILVTDGGKFEVHGERKLSWTKLTETVTKSSRQPTLHLLDDASTWKVGKVIMVTKKL